MDGGLSITFALTDKGMLWGDDGVFIAQPRRSGTVFDGNYCHASTAVATSAKRTVLLHLYAGRGLTARQLLETFQCLARESGPPESLQCYIMNQGGQLWMAKGGLVRSTMRELARATSDLLIIDASDRLTRWIQSWGLDAI